MLPVLIELLQCANHLWKDEGRNPPGIVKPATCELQAVAAASALGTLLDKGCFSQPNVQTYFAIIGDTTLSFQHLQVVLAMVVGMQMWIMQAVVFHAQHAAVGIFQVEKT